MSLAYSANATRRGFAFVSATAFVCAGWVGICHAEPNLTGQTGLINMPDGRIEADGTWRFGYAFQRPYSSIWGNLSILPRVEATARFTRIMGIPGFENKPEYGDYKDKVFQGKVLLLQESEYLPAVSFGLNDYFGTELFPARFLAASKQVGPLDLTLGYGNGRMDGLYGGVRATTPIEGLKLVAEYDNNKYAQDNGALQNGVINRKKGVGVGFEYRWGWLGTQVSWRDGDFGINGYLSLPLESPGFIPKVEEPKGFREVPPRPTEEEWRSDQSFEHRMVDVLKQNDFRNIGLRFESGRMEAVLGNSRISTASRAIGRAARILLLLSPQQTRELKITYAESGLPVSTYTFTDLGRLRRYFNGQIGRRELAQHVSIEAAKPDPRPIDETQTWDGMDEARASAVVFDKRDGAVLAFRGKGYSNLDFFQISPKLALYLNDPSGAFRYSVFLRGTYEKQLGPRTFFGADLDMNVIEDVSKVNTPSNSTLPHVRTDVADYKRDASAVRLGRATVNHLMHPAERVYARASAGIYEEMFAGVGGQMLYLPAGSPWAFDLTADWVRQRDTKGWFGLRDYSTVTGYLSAHTKLPVEGLTGTVRLGRFLAQDVGARFEIKRRFRSGVEMGAWYTHTNGNDITSPGTPEKPYHDKGIFLSLPLNTVLTQDTRAKVATQLSPWTRDVGQMVAGMDLYSVVESSYRNRHEGDGLRYFGDLDDDYTVPAPKTIVDRMQWDAFRREIDAVSGSLISDDAALAFGKGVGAVVLSSTLDRPFNRLGEKYQDSRSFRWVAKFGKWAPPMALAVAGLYALDPMDERLNGAALGAVKAGTLAYLVSQGSKYAFGRARPLDGEGPYQFSAFSLSNSPTSFPSNHASVIWAALTPFAREYEMPWLYGVAAAASLGRVAGRQHWFSDIVAGGLLGYAAGTLTYDAPRSAKAGGAEVIPIPGGAAVSVGF